MFRANRFGFPALLLLACQNAQGLQPPAANDPAAVSGISMGMQSGLAGSPAIAVGAPAPAATAGPASGINTPATPASASSAAAAASPDGPPSAAMPDAPAASPSAAAAPASSAGNAATAPAADSCMRYARANRVVIDLGWPETLVWAEGSGQFVTWLKNTYTKQPDGNTLVESRLCGALMPVMTSTDFVGGLKSSAQMPLSAFESPSLPVLHSTLSTQSGLPQTRDVTMVLGATLSDPHGAWPKSNEITPADDDGDGAPGMTMVPERGPEFLEPPTSVSQLEFIDRLYIAARARVQVTAAPTCSGPSEAQLEPLAFDSTPLGCHVKDRDDCTAEELRFVMSQNPQFKLRQSGRWVEADVALDASCETVRATLP